MPTTSCWPQSSTPTFPSSLNDALATLYRLPYRSRHRHRVLSVSPVVVRVAWVLASDQPPLSLRDTYYLWNPLPVFPGLISENFVTPSPLSPVVLTPDICIGFATGVTIVAWFAAWLYAICPERAGKDYDQHRIVWRFVNWLIENNIEDTWYGVVLPLLPMALPIFAFAIIGSELARAFAVHNPIPPECIPFLHP